MADKLAFVEVPEQLTHVPIDYHVVSLSPLVEVFLERSSRPYTRPEDYLDEALLEEEGIANFAKVEVLCDALDTIFANAVPEVAEHELQPARWDYFWLKIVYDAFFLRHYQLRRVLSAEAPGEVIYFQRSQPDLSREWLSQTESIYAGLLDHLLPQVAIPGKKLGPVAENVAYRHGVRQHVGTLVRRMYRGASRRARQALRLLGRVKRRTWIGRVLCLDHGFNIPYIAPQLERLGYDVWLWSDGSEPHRIGSFNKRILDGAIQLPGSQISAIWRAVAANQTVRSLFLWEGYDLWPAVAPRLRRLVEHRLPEVLANYMLAQNILRQIRPQVVLMSMATLSREKAICHAARRTGIPSVDTRHAVGGSFYAPLEMYKDPDSVAWILCPGRWEQQYWDRYSKRQVSTVVVGSPMIEAAAQKALRRDVIRRQLGYPLDRKLVLYVLHTMQKANYWYSSNLYPTDNSYFRLGQSIVRALVDLNDWKVVLKEHPGTVDSPLEKWCKSIDTNGRVSVIWGPDLAQLSHLADVVVLDSASTRLAQVLTGSARIYIVGHPNIRWEPGVVEHLTATGVVFCAAEDLEERIRADVMAGQIGTPWQYPANAIEPMVAASSEPGGAARRAAQAIVQIATRAHG